MNAGNDNAGHVVETAEGPAITGYGYPGYRYTYDPIYSQPAASVGTPQQMRSPDNFIQPRNLNENLNKNFNYNTNSQDKHSTKFL